MAIGIFCKLALRGRQLFARAQFVNPGGGINDGYPDFQNGVNQDGTLRLINGARDPRIIEVGTKFLFSQMQRRNMLDRLTAVLVVTGAALVLVAGLRAQQPEHGNGSSSRSAQPGRRTFTTTCAGCHGLDGRGGERGPNIAGSAKLQHLSDAKIFQIVSSGVPGTGMPAFGALGVPEVQAVVSYLRFLQGRRASTTLPGDPVQGKAIFFGKAECSSCHMMQGQGGFLGSDLSSYGSARSAAEILDVITRPAENPGSNRKFVVAVTHAGLKVTGLVRNEDNFSLQLLTSEGAFYFLQRTDLESFEYQDHPAMPSNYGERLNRAELNDLASYLMNVGRSEKADRSVKREED